ncbi:serine hydrolase [Xylophilus sp. GOD-11R]|uniref:serine hydrolase n=1 Tax=Xylophilus sp. GOD-11R TaxID=3089814 RepID=UPI00298C287E|nr:serine hydrolase [Xylophilus sp. GOD-11R]WPB57964.1 serine hydrolase [Xylophilus sp. GOD-11R]
MHRPATPPRARAAVLLLLSALVASATLPARADEWPQALKTRIEAIDKASPGSLGVYVKRLDSGESFGYGADQRWYLASTVKVAVAIALLRQVDDGKLRLQQQLTLEESDKVDGSGQVVWTATGTRFTLDSLLDRMLGVSDNTAANMLIRAVGEDKLNDIAVEAMGKGNVGRITNFTAIRRQVYAELDEEGAKKLSNRQLVEIAGATMGPPRVEAARRAMSLERADLEADTIDEAYDRYYANGANSATMEAYGAMLEKLVRGKLLSPQSTQRLFAGMKFGKPGDYRLEAGLPRSVKRIHKTGTQYRRACHMAVVDPQDGGAHAVVIAACAADLDDRTEAGGVFQQVGKAVSATALADTRK